MIKVRVNYTRIEILFWDAIFRLMKGLQNIRDCWIDFVHYIKPSLKLHITLLFSTCTIGLGVGFVMGVIKLYFSGW